jgi:hypothetical protein
MARASKLTQNAKKCLFAYLRLVSRDELAAMIEGCGGAAYDDEPVEDFIMSVIDSMEAGDIPFDTSLAYAKSLNDNEAWQAWLDVEDWWE